MDTQRIDEKAIFNTARQIADVMARGDYLAQVCGDDQSAIWRIQELLRIHEQEQSFLESSPAMAADWERTALHNAAVSEGPGTVIGPYKLLQQIGEGGMGVVFMAEQTEPIQRTVALKIIKPGMDTRQVIARFEAERQAVAMMDHPNIAKVLDAGTTSVAGSLREPLPEVESVDDASYGTRSVPTTFGRPYFVMELVKGVPITKYCDEKHLPLPARLELFIQVCQAVQHAHQKGVIHRDLKPNNVLVAEYDDQPVPKVIDFGVAKATAQKLTERTLFTEFGQVVGTMEYMSPEQSKFNQLDVDTRSDIYSLGVLLYELLAGSTPFEGKRLHAAAFDEMLRIIREEEPPKPSTRLSSIETLPSVAVNRHTEPARLSKDVQGELDWIVMKALEKDRNRRYETASGLAADVERHLHDEPVEAGPTSTVYRLRKFVHKNRTPLTAAACFGLVLIGASVVSTWQALRATRAEALARDQQRLAQRSADDANAQRAEAEEQTQLAKQERSRANEQATIARRRFYAAQMNLAMQAAEQGEIARTLELLERQRPRSGEKDFRGFEWYYLWRICHKGLRARLDSRHTWTVYTVAFFPDGKTLAAADHRHIKLFDVMTAREIRTWRSKAWGLAISPDGKTLGSWSYDDPTRLWDATSGEQLAVFEGATSCTFSPDGETVVLSRPPDLEFWDVRAKQRRSVLIRAPDKDNFPNDTTLGAGAFVFSPDGNNAVARVQQEVLGVYRRDADTWRQDTKITGHGSWWHPVAFSHDGHIFAVGGEFLRLYATDTGKVLGTFVGHTGDVYSLAFSPDGKSLASAGDRTVRVWDLASQIQRTSYPHPAPVYSVAYSPDGNTLASSGAATMLRLWDVASAEPPDVLKDGPNRPYVAFSPDGNTLLACGADVKMWDVATGQETGTMDCLGEAMALSHDGKLLVRAIGSDVAIWDLPARRQIATLSGHTHTIHCLAFSPDDKTLITGSQDDSARMWDVATGDTRFIIKPGTRVSAVAFSPDGRTLAIGTLFERVTLFDAKTGQERLNLQRHDHQGDGPWTWSVAFSPDGKLLAASSKTGTIRLWDINAARLHAALQGHTSNVWCVAFSPDGYTLATASDDGTVRLWDTETGQERATLRLNSGPVRTVSFSSDGATLAAATTDGMVKLWRTSHEPEATARRDPFAFDDVHSVTALIEAGERLTLASRMPEAEQAYEEALARLQESAAEFPNDVRYRTSVAHLLNQRAWRLATHPDTEKRDPQRTIELAKRAVDSAPKQGNFWNTLGVAQYRAGDWNASVEALEKAIELTNGGGADNWFFLAMAHWQLGHEDEARKWYEQAVEWMDKNHTQSEELIRFRTEVEELLEIADKKNTTKKESK